MRHTHFSHLWGAAAALILVSCGQAEVVRAKVDVIAQKLSDNLASVRTSEQDFVSAADSVYANLDRASLSTKGMDVKDGGIFQTFQGNTYYYKTVHEGASFYLSPMRPVDDGLRRDIKALQQTEGLLKTAYEKNSDVMVLSFFGVRNPLSIGMLYPWIDVVSFLPPKIDFAQQEWFTRGLASGKAAWSHGPFVSLFGGWVEDISAPVAFSPTSQGVVVMTVVLEKINKKYFADEPENLFMVGPDLTLVMANKPARAALDLKVIEDVDYIKQMRENAFAGDVYKLSDPGQPPEIQAMATQIAAGKKAFPLVAKGRTWNVFVAKVPETGFFVAGFAP